MTMKGPPRQTQSIGMTGLDLAANPSYEMSHEDSFGVYRREFDYVWRTLRRLGVHGNDVEDLVHEVFLVLHRRWKDYDPTRPLRPYLFGISYRVAAAHHRRRAHEVPGRELELVDEAPEPEQAMQTQQARALVLQALEKLPLQRRAVIIMHDLDEVPMREIARTLSIPLFTAYSRLRKGRVEFGLEVARIRGGSERP
jgi:RNA polymerase sigma-70 factor, ECF subfamily